MVSVEKRKVRFDYGFKVGSDLEVLMDYLSNLDNVMFREAVVQSARSYWLPLALRKAGVTGVDLEVAGNNAATDLIRQAKEICLKLEIDPGQFVGLLGGRVAPASVSSEQPSSRTEVPVVATEEHLESDESNRKPESKTNNLWEGMADGFSQFENFPGNPVD